MPSGNGQIVQGKSVLDSSQKISKSRPHGGQGQHRSWSDSSATVRLASDQADIWRPAAELRRLGRAEREEAWC